MADRIVTWGIVGPGSIARNVADAILAAPSARLGAVAGRDPARLAAFADRYAIPAGARFITPGALFATPGIDAVYVATPHPAHAGLALAALRAGKHVLVEKPAGLTAGEVTALTEAAAQEGRLLMEGFMYRCHPQIARMLEILAAGEIGELRHIRAAFGFDAPFNPASRLWSAEEAGGGILDVGGYPVSLARLVAGAAEGRPFADPVVVRGTARLAPTGVDAAAWAVLRFASGVTAEVAAACGMAMDNRARITGTKGEIVLDDPWVPGRNAGPSDATLHITAGGETRTEVLRHPEQLFTFEVEVASRAILDGLTEAPHPAMGHADSLGNARTLDRWRAEAGVGVPGDAPATIRRLSGTLPAGLPAMRFGTIPGLATPVSRLILGCDNQETLNDAAILWDAWMEAGGNAFDTAFIYGGGRQETLLGQWIAARGVAKDIVVIAKGAHSPYCLPQAIAPQLAISLDRLGLDHVPVYILHRDNPEIPAGEFVDALNALKAQGRIGVFGGSNWSAARIAEANAYAARTGQQGFAILNNNLSLAAMERPVWAGCIASRDAATLAFLKESGLAHLSWSSQARGYFLPEALRNRLPPDTAPETCFGSPANAARRARAEAMAAARGVTANNVALAWVLAQDFPSFALIGARTPGEIATTLPALALDLTAEERDRLSEG